MQLLASDTAATCEAGERGVQQRADALGEAAAAEPLDEPRLTQCAKLTQRWNIGLLIPAEGSSNDRSDAERGDPTLCCPTVGVSLFRRALRRRRRRRRRRLLCVQVVEKMLREVFCACIDECLTEVGEQCLQLGPLSCEISIFLE